MIHISVKKRQNSLADVLHTVAHVVPTRVHCGTNATFNQSQDTVHAVLDTGGPTMLIKMVKTCHDPCFGQKCQNSIADALHIIAHAISQHCGMT